MLLSLLSLILVKRSSHSCGWGNDKVREKERYGEELMTEPLFPVPSSGCWIDACKCALACCLAFPLTMFDLALFMSSVCAGLTDLLFTQWSLDNLRYCLIRGYSYGSRVQIVRTILFSTMSSTVGQYACKQPGSAGEITVLMHACVHL